MKIIILLATVLTLLTGCGPSQQEYEETRQHAAELEAQLTSLQAESTNLRAESTALQTKLTALRSELEDIKFGANRLLAQAKSAYEVKNDAEAKKLLSDLMQRHPSSPEIKEASVLIAQVDFRIAIAEQQRKREEEQKAQEERRAFERALGNMKKSTDEMTNITWISHRNAPVSGKHVSVYFGSRKGSAKIYPLRLKLQYQGDDWLFVHSVIVKADDTVYELDNLKFERDHSSGTVWEWIDMPIENHRMLNHCLSAKRVVVRFNGAQYYNDFILPKGQQTQLREVYQAWKVMGGNPHYPEEIQ